MLPDAAAAVFVGMVTSEVFHIDPAADSVDLQMPVTAFCASVAEAGQKAAFFLAVAADVGAGTGTLTNGKQVTVNGVSLPSILFGALGGWSGYPAGFDRICLALLSATATAPVVTAKTMYNA